MEILPHIPVDNYNATNFSLTEWQEFLSNLKTILDGIDFSDYATKEDLNALAAELIALRESINARLDSTDESINSINSSISDINTQISNILSEISVIKSKLPTDSLSIINTTFTNPRYFWASSLDHEHYSVGVSTNLVAFSFFGIVGQEVDLDDERLEIVNISLTRNVNIDFNTTPNHMYFTLYVDYFEGEKYTHSESFPVDAELSSEINSYDISVYFKGGIIAGVNENTKFRLCGVVPYFVERS